MKYTLQIARTQIDHVGEAPPVQEFADRFNSVAEAVSFAEAMIRQHDAPQGAWRYDVLDEARNPVVTDAEP